MTRSLQRIHGIAYSKRSKLVALVISHFLAVLTCSGADTDNSSTNEPIPDARVQEHIREFIECCATPDESMKEMSVDELRSVASNRCDAVFSDAQIDYADFAIEIVLSYATTAEIRSRSKESQAKRYLLSQLLNRSDHTTVVGRIAPYLETTTNAVVLAGVQSILDQIMKCSGRDTTFEAFGPYLSRHQSSPPPRLVEQMYLFNPDGAVVAFALAYGNDTLSAFKQAHKRARRSEQLLRSFASGGKWWEELYVATVLHYEPALRSKGLADALAESEAVLVRGMQARSSHQKTPRGSKRDLRHGD